MPEHQQIYQSKKPDTIFQKQTTPISQTPISNPYSIIQRAKINPKSLTHADIMQLQRTIGNQAVGRLLSSIGSSSTVHETPIQRSEIPEEEEKPMQGKFEAVQRSENPEEEPPMQGKFESIQRQEAPEDEEPLQGKFEDTPEIACLSCFAAPIVQKQASEEKEKPLQGKLIGTIQRQEIPEEEPLQGKMAETVQRQEIPEEEPLQKKKENNTGMPNNLKAGVESLSVIDMSGVRVHYNSSKPAEVEALAYTQGTDIHLATSQEKHLPHEAWHAVQQIQGRVRPTMQMKGVAINDEVELEHEADVMGAKASHVSDVGPKQYFATQRPIFYAPNSTIQCVFELANGDKITKIRNIVNQDRKPKVAAHQKTANILIATWYQDKYTHRFDNAEAAADFILRFAGVYIETNDLAKRLSHLSQDILNLHASMESQHAQTARSAQILQRMMNQYLITRKLLENWQWDLGYARQVVDFIDRVLDGAEVWLSGDFLDVSAKLPHITLPRVREVPWNGEPVQHLFGVLEGLNSSDIELRKKQIGLLRGADDENNPTIRDAGDGRGHLKGAIPFPFIAACRKGLMGLVQQVGDSVAVFSLERGGSLLGDHIVDFLELMEERRLSHVKVAKTRSGSDDEQHGLLVAKMMDVEEGHMFRYMNSHPLVLHRPPPIVMSIAETAVSGSSADQVLKTLHRCSDLIPHTRVRVLVEKQTIKEPRLMGQPLGGVRVQDPGIHLPENLDTEDLSRVELFVSQVPYILGEDVAYQCTYHGVVRGQPIMIFDERNSVLVAVQLAQAGVLPRDMLRMLVLGAFDDLLSKLMI